MVYLAIRWQYKWFFCKSFRSWYYFTHKYKTFIPSTDVIKYLFVREYLWKLPEGLLPDFFLLPSVSYIDLCLLIVNMDFEYVFIYDTLYTYIYIYTAHTNCHVVSKSNEAMQFSNNQDAARQSWYAVFCFSFKRRSQKYRTEDDW